MTNVGSQCTFLKASAELKSGLQLMGEKQHYFEDQVLFHEDDRNSGVFLLLKGKIRMSIKGLPKLDRLFSTRSVLGLPSTFTGHDYSLTALALTEADVIRVPAESFVQLMRERADLCREATEMLGREVSFIQAALAERRKQAAKSKLHLELGSLT